MKNELVKDEVFLLQLLNTFMLLFFRNEGHVAEIEMYEFHYTTIF